MAKDDVLLEGEQPAVIPGAPAAGADKGKEKDELATLRADNARLTKSNTELGESERYWAEQAKNGRKPEADEDETPAQKKKVDDEWDENEEASTFVDDLSAKGIKALQKRGMLTKKQATEMIEERATEIATKIARDIVGKARTSMTADAKLVSQFPELQDEKSDLFKETKRIFAENCAEDPSLKKSQGALMMAAKQAKLELQIKTGKTSTTQSEEDREQARIERIAGQQGSRGRRGAAEFTEDDDDTIGPEARTMLTQFARYGVTDDDYKKEVKKTRGGR